MKRSLPTLCLLFLTLAACAATEAPDDTKRIVIFGATGSIGQAVVAEALARGHDVVGVSRSPENFDYSELNFSGVRGNPTDQESVTELLRGADAAIIAVGGRSATVPEETAMNQTAIAFTSALAEQGNEGPRVVVIGGGMTMLGSPEKMIENMPPPATEGSALRALFLGHWVAYETYQGSDINWTFLAPPMRILGFRSEPGARTGAYRTSTTEHLVSSEGENEISLADLAVAAVDFAEQPLHKRVKVTVGY